MKVYFKSLASGSSGNCYYIGTENREGILVDAGIPVRTIRKRLKEDNIGMEDIRAILVTHDHTDHIKAIGPLGEKGHIPVYATPLTHKGINQSYCTTIKLCDAVQYIEKYHPIQLSSFNIEAFDIPHDGTDNVGYCIEVASKTFTILTDLGTIPPHAIPYIQQADFLVIEANYDEKMLQTGRYPAHLKSRIASQTGHMSNQATALFLAEHLTPKQKRIWLCHLSKENNQPDLAYNTIEQALCSKGIIAGQDVELHVLERTSPSELYEL